MDNLSRCMILCEKEGYGPHYGIWRATKGEAPIFEVEVVTPEGWKKCEYCGDQFKPSRSDQKFCGAYCQSKASNKRCKKKKKRKGE